MIKQNKILENKRQTNCLSQMGFARVTRVPFPSYPILTVLSNTSPISSDPSPSLETPSPETAFFFGEKKGRIDPPVRSNLVPRYAGLEGGHEFRHSDWAPNSIDFTGFSSSLLGLGCKGKGRLSHGWSPCTAQACTGVHPTRSREKKHAKRYAQRGNGQSPSWTRTRKNG